MISSPAVRRPGPLLVLAAALLGGAGVESPPSAPAASPLHDGLTLEREIRKGEAQSYTVDLAAGQFLRVTAQEDGIDLTLLLRGPGGGLVVAADSLNRDRPEALEDLAAVAPETGTYRLDVTSGGSSKAGRYTLRAEGPRAPDGADRLRAEAVAATSAGLVAPPPHGSAEERHRELQRAADLWKQAGEPQRAAQCLYWRGEQRQKAGDLAGAARDFEDSGMLWAAAPGAAAGDWAAWALNTAGIMLRESGRLGEAQPLYERALEQARTAGDGQIESMALSNLGMLASEGGEPRRGVELQLQALAAARKASDPKQEADSLGNLAYAYRQAGDAQEALKRYGEMRRLARARGWADREALALNELASLHSTLGDFGRAAGEYRDTLALNRKAGDRAGQAKTLNNLGTVQQRLERFRDAETSFARALDLARGLKDGDTQAQILVNQAFLALRLGRKERALALAKEALPLAGASKEREAQAHFALGTVHRALRDRAAARRELQAALALHEERGALLDQADVGLALARVEREAGDLTAALERVRAAIGIVEDLRLRVADQDLRASFSAVRQDYYELQTDTLMALHARAPAAGWAARALAASEQARARILLEVLDRSGADIREGADPALVARERRLRDEVNARAWDRVRLLAQGRAAEARAAEAGRRLEEAIEEYHQVQASLQAGSPRYAALTQPKPLDLAAIRARDLDGRALLLEYSLGAERSFLWVVGPRTFASFVLPGRAAIEGAARRYYKLLTVRNDRGRDETFPAWKARIDASDREAVEAGRELSRLILNPARQLLADRPLLVVTDGALQYVPFAALPEPGSGEPLIARHGLATLPSATALAALRREARGRRPAGQALAVFADPVFQKDDPRLAPPATPAGPVRRGPDAHLRGTLPGAAGREVLDLSRLPRLNNSRKEAEAIAALLPPGQVFKAVDFDASKATVRRVRLDRFRRLHFATHGVLDSEHPELSGLVLSLFDRSGRRIDDGGGVLRLNDVYNLRLNADLVVLSACRTALGKEVRGEGLIGLTRGFMYAGAARVLASLWSIEDGPTADLMTDFYRRMLREGLPPAEALRRTQIEMSRDPKRSSPYYWAGFSLQGEWE